MAELPTWSGWAAFRPLLAQIAGLPSLLTILGQHEAGSARQYRLLVLIKDIEIDAYQVDFPPFLRPAEFGITGEAVILTYRCRKTEFLVDMYRTRR